MSTMQACAINIATGDYLREVLPAAAPRLVEPRLPAPALGGAKGGVEGCEPGPRPCELAAGCARGGTVELLDLLLVLVFSSSSPPEGEAKTWRHSLLSRASAGAPIMGHPCSTCATQPVL